jgi:hypothetical protein
VEREFLFASNLKLGLLPLLYRYCELPLSYLNLNYIDVQGNNYRRNFDEILGALGNRQASLPSQKEVINTPPGRLSRKSMNTNLPVLIVALKINAHMANLLAK